MILMVNMLKRIDNFVLQDILPRTAMSRFLEDFQISCTG
jgi:hypothetical protein